MLKRFVAAVIILAGVTVVDACRNPYNVFCIIFDDRVSMDLSVFKDIGEEDVNYIKSAESSKDIVMNGLTDVYSYKSHYSINVMVEVGAGGINFVVDSNAVSLKDFRADSCVSEELEWLTDAGVLSMERVERENISEAFADGFQSYIYWAEWEVKKFSGRVPVEDDSGNVTWAPVDCYSSYTINYPPEELSLRTGIIHSEEIYRNIKSNRLSLDNKEGSTLIDIRGRRVKSVNGDVRGLKSANIILEYNPETGVKKHYIGKVK